MACDDVDRATLVVMIRRQHASNVLSFVRSFSSIEIKSNQWQLICSNQRATSTNNFDNFSMNFDEKNFLKRLYGRN